jgi:hypothetical protein
MSGKCTVTLELDAQLVNVEMDVKLDSGIRSNFDVMTLNGLIKQLGCLHKLHE